MTTKTIKRSTEFKRCGVCKIDLKGNFVFIDDETELFLGWPKEELFGKSLFDFLDKSSQSLIEELLTRRNHYETFYDTTTVTFVDRTNKPTKVSLVVSLNFIAGNPVNFQLIINRYEGNITDDGNSLLWFALYDFINSLSGIGDVFNWREHLRLLRKLTGASQLAVYKIMEQSLEPRAVVTDDDSTRFAFNSIPELTDLHRQVAQTGKTYSFIDKEAVNRALEEYGVSPDEFIVRVKVSENDLYLLRMIFSTIKPDSVAESVEQARAGIMMIEKLMQTTGIRGDDANESFDVKFTVGFLDSLDIGSLLIQTDGQIVGYNSALLKLIDKDDIEGSYRDFIDLLIQYNNPTLETTIETYFNKGNVDGFQLDLSLPLKLINGEAARLVIVRFSEEANDLSACFALIPESAVFFNRDLQDLPQGKMWPSIISSMKSELKKVTVCTDKLTNEYYNQLGHKGNTCLENLSERVRYINGMYDELAVIMDCTNSEQETQLTDLNLLFNRVLHEIRSVYTGIDIKCNFQKMPKIKTNRKKASRIFYNIISNGIRFNNNDKVIINISSEILNDACKVSVSGNSASDPWQQVDNIFDFFNQMPSSNVKVLPGDGTSFAMTRQLVDSLGWEIDFTSDSTEKNGVTIIIPSRI